MWKMPQYATHKIYSCSTRWKPVRTLGFPGAGAVEVISQSQYQNVLGKIFTILMGKCSNFELNKLWLPRAQKFKK